MPPAASARRMGKRAAGAATCQPPEISQRPQSRRKKTPDDPVPASGLSSCSCRSATATSRAVQRPRQGKKATTTRVLRPTAAAATTAQEARLRGAVSVSWRAKRRRTVRFGPAAVGSRWRDWAGLDEGPAGMIADRVLAGDVADYVRFRAACRPWRRCCADPRARGVLEDPRLYPRHWIMLRDDDDHERLAPHGTRRRFLNTGTGQCVQVDVPELRDHAVLRAAAAAGLLILHRKADKAVRVLNPLTRQVTELPPTTGLEFSLGRAGLLDHGTVFLCSYRSCPGTMAIARPGDDHWALIDAGPEQIEDTVFFAGRFFGLTLDGIVAVDMTGGGGRGPRLVVAAELPKPFTFRAMLNDTVHLVDNGNEDLRLVHRMQRRVRGLGDDDDDYTYKRMYRVYRVNLSTGKTTARGRRDLGDRAIFIDFYGALSVSARVFPFLSVDTIYLGLHCGERDVVYGHIGAYHVRDGSIETPGNNYIDSQRSRLLARPLSIADSLIAYVSCHD